MSWKKVLLIVLGIGVLLWLLSRVKPSPEECVKEWQALPTMPKRYECATCRTIVNTDFIMTADQWARTLERHPIGYVIEWYDPVDAYLNRCQYWR